MARPKSKTARTSDIRVRVTAKERRAFAVAAAAESLPISTWLRRLGCQAAKI